MGYKRKKKTHRLDFKDYEDFKGLEVHVKPLSVGQVLTLGRLATKDDQTEEELETIFRILSQGLVDWNLEDDDGNEIPPTYESVLELDQEMASTIIEAWVSGVTKVDEELGKGSPSGEKSPVPLPTMEAL